MRATVPRTRRLAALLFFALAALAAVTLARADGEAGLVIQDGDAVRTFCVAFKGESITGDQLLAAAGQRFDQFGGSARTLCSINGRGCSDASSFDTCFCKCQSGGGDCTYWAFFTLRYGGSWSYSAIGFNLARARDGDLHGWRWGKGSLQSAPPPASMSFEQICGHAPRGGGLQATATPPQATATGASTASSANPTAGAPALTPGGGPVVTTTFVPSTSAPASSGSASSEPLTPAPGSATAAPTALITIGNPATAEESDDQNDGARGPGAGLVAFAAVAGLLGLGIAVALVRRARHGA